jgi:uncharacterized damage-inducible protein DinB
MTVKDLERLYDYGYWANRKLFLVALQLTPEQFTQDVAGSYGYVREFLSKLKDDDLTRIVEFMNPRGEKRSGVLGALLEHGATHGVHHRGQVALLLRALGYTPGNFDRLFYDAENRSVLAW